MGWFVATFNEQCLIISWYSFFFALCCNFSSYNMVWFVWLSGCVWTTSIFQVVFLSQFFFFFFVEPPNFRLWWMFQWWVVVLGERCWLILWIEFCGPCEKMPIDSKKRKKPKWSGWICQVFHFVRDLKRCVCEVSKFAWESFGPKIEHVCLYLIDTIGKLKCMKANPRITWSKKTLMWILLRKSSHVNIICYISSENLKNLILLWHYHVFWIRCFYFYHSNYSSGIYHYFCCS